MVRVLIVDDQMISRQLFFTVLSGSGRYLPVAALSSAGEAVAFCRRDPVDLVLMDVVMADGMNGLDAAREIRRIRPDIRIVVVTSMPEASWLKRARAIGVDSFWYKEAQEQPILAVMERTMAGEHIYPDQTPTVQIGCTNNHEFTERELEVLRELISGDSNAEIGQRLGIGAGTVKYHVQNMLEKTGMHTRTELAAVARSLGIAIK